MYCGETPVQVASLLEEEWNETPIFSVEWHCNTHSHW